MIKLKFSPEFAPVYQTEQSAGADLVSTIDLCVKAGQKAKFPTGVWIESVDWSQVPQGCIPELQIRARSGLAYKHGICLTNGVGTIDADYPDEICVLLWNSSDTDFTISKGDRIAQMVLNLCHKIPMLEQKGLRTSGFGSTGVRV
ncbi:MAG: dUTP diphosphatase [Oligoflexales bacterium]|nr:dUTP diphosphatase [Oligoflexales bacterium]